MPALDDLTFQMCGVTMNREQLGDKLPMPTYQSNIKEHFMTDGEDGNGIRVLEPLGAHSSHCDFEFTADLLSASELATFEAAFFDQREPKTLRIQVPLFMDKTYTFLFAADGFKPEMMDTYVEYFHDTPYKATFRLHIMTVNATGS